MVHKCLHHRMPIYLKDKLVYRSTSQVHNRQLRSVDNNDLNLPHCRLSTGQRSFAFRGAKVWNSLPLDLKLTPSLRTFKKNVCELLLNNLSFISLDFLIFFSNSCNSFNLFLSQSFCYLDIAAEKPFFRECNKYVQKTVLRKHAR